ncbi:MAG: hypothetical protein RIC89_20740 [Pseudomonadales bacterium]
MAQTSPEEQSAYACAESARGEIGISSYEVVRMVRRSGNGNFRFWMNSNEDNSGVYCETTALQVKRLFTKATPWLRTHTYKPDQQDLAAK